MGTYINGLAFKPADWVGAGRPIIRIQNLTDPSRPYNLTTRDVPDKVLVRPGDILVSWSATLDAFRWQGPEAVLNQHIFKVVPNAELVSDRYLYWGLKRVIQEMWASEHTHGSTMRHINRGPFLAHPFPLPPPAEQDRIVAEIEKQLTRLDAGVTALKRLQAHLRRYRASVMASAFQPLNGHGLWRRVTLGELIAVGPQNGLYLPKSRYGAGTPILRIDDYQDFASRDASGLRLVAASREEVGVYGLRAGDLVVNRVNSPSHLGKVMLVEPRHVPALFESNMMRFTLGPDALPAYISLYLRSPAGRASMTANAKWAVNQASINQQDVRATEVPLPPVPEQAAVVARLSEMLTSVQQASTAAELNLARAQRLRAAVLRSAFAGTLPA